MNAFWELEWKLGSALVSNVIQMHKYMVAMLVYTGICNKVFFRSSIVLKKSEFVHFHKKA